ncbi:hypothetical protein ACFQY3_05190 [Paenibacillus farraposensis]
MAVRGKNEWPFYEPAQLCGILNAEAKEAEAGLPEAGCRQK